MMVAAAAAGFGFAANQLSPRGLNLARDYFPKAANSSPAPPKVSPPAAANPAPVQEDPQETETRQRIKEKGLQPISRADTERLFHDPRYQQGLLVFIDARSGDYYAASHVPGAYHLDRYHPEKDLANVLTPCQNAEQVVLYCMGGECEDAEYTALLLRDAGIPAQKLFVYGGGFDDWAASHLPLEQGDRNSGVAPAQSP